MGSENLEAVVEGLQVGRGLHKRQNGEESLVAVGWAGGGGDAALGEMYEVENTSETPDYFGAMRKCADGKFPILPNGERLIPTTNRTQEISAPDDTLRVESAADDLGGNGGRGHEIAGAKFALPLHASGESEEVRTLGMRHESSEEIGRKLIVGIEEIDPLSMGRTETTVPRTIGSRDRLLKNRYLMATLAGKSLAEGKRGIYAAIVDKNDL